MKLADLICIEGVNTSLVEVTDARVAKKLPDWIPSCVPFDISDVSRYLFEVTEQENWNVGEDFQCMAPPYPTFWLEYTAPSIVRSEIHGIHTVNGWPKRTGFFVEAEDADEIHEKIKTELGLTDYALGLKARVEAASRAGQLSIIHEKLRRSRDQMEFKLSLTEAERWTQEVIEELEQIKEHGLEEGQRIYERKKALNGKWYLTFYGFELLSPIYGPHIVRDTVVGPIAQWSFLIHEDGHVIEHRYSTTPQAYAISQKFAEEQHQQAGLYSMFFPAFLALDWMHLNNVSVRKTENPVKLQKAHRKRYGKPMLTFHVLDIAPLTRVLKEAGAEKGKSGLKKALHSVRLHYAHFGEQYGTGKLFGKLEGKFLIPAHMRGSKKEGTVVKEYAVKRPKGGWLK